MIPFSRQNQPRHSSAFLQPPNHPSESNPIAVTVLSLRSTRIHWVGCPVSLSRLISPTCSMAVMLLAILGPQALWQQCAHVNWPLSVVFSSLFIRKTWFFFHLTLVWKTEPWSILKYGNRSSTLIILYINMYFFPNMGTRTWWLCHWILRESMLGKEWERI